MEGPDTGLCALPLNLLALIVSNVDNVPDLARLCRTSKVLYYMSVPRLYQKIVLTSYAEVQYKNGVPEGYGGASPFTMGLNALVTSNAASLVKSLVLQGEFPQYDLEDKARIGRVPDGSMLLNIAVRAALGRCVNLEYFRWSMDFRLMNTAYAGLTQLKALRRLHLKFTSSRIPQPTIVVPAMPNLISFAFTDYDPLGYPDDLSEMFFQATKLQDLTMHFSPRMRQVGESSLHLSRFFKKNIAAGRSIRLRRFAMHNSFARLEPEILVVFDGIVLEHIVNINSLGTVGNTFANHFLDRTWDYDQPKKLDNTAIHTFRCDMVTAAMPEDMADMAALRYLYFIGTKRDFSCESPPKSNNTPPVSSKRYNSITSASAPSPTLDLILLDVICDKLGPQLRHIIYPNRFTLSRIQLTRLLQSCPNLTQLSFAAEEPSFELLRHIVSHAAQLQILRIKHPDVPCGEGMPSTKRFADFEAAPDHKERLELELLAAHDMFSADCGSLRYIGIGDRVWHVGSAYEEFMTYTDDEGTIGAQTLRRRSIFEVDILDVMDIEIWRMDTPDWVEWDF